MGASCSSNVDAGVVKSRGHGAPQHLRHMQPASSSKLNLNRQRLKNPDGTINRPWKPENGKVRWQGISEETMDLTDAEIDLVVLPAIELLEHGRVLKLCSEDLLLRCTRGYTNNSPDTKQFQACVPNVGNHVAALAEALDRILNCRHNEKVQANALLTRKLPHSAKFHGCSPQTVSGMDKYGHYILCERISDIDFGTVTGSFALEEFLLYSSQRAEAFQLLQTKEGLNREASGQGRVYKHVHIIDLSGVSMMQFIRLKSTLLPIFKHGADQYPNTMWKIFCVNTPGLFSGIWSVLKSVIDPETAAKVNILSIGETATSEQRFREAGIEKDQLPPWLFNGACGKETSMQEVCEMAMTENVYESESRLHDVYYPPLNRRLADRLSVSSGASSLPVAEVKAVPKRSKSEGRSKSMKRSLSHAPPITHSHSSALQWSIVVLLVLVLCLLMFVAWNQVFAQSSTTCNCNCPHAPVL